ncbi:MAG: L-seryl-tRNA(Sec) selenium transferase [Spirochaetota bacterium]
MRSNPYRGIPQVEKLLADPRIAAWSDALSRPLVTRLVIAATTAARRAITDSGTSPSPEELIGKIEVECRHLASRKIRKVINATGVILHTNMGRAPLSSELWDAARETNIGYSNLELNLDSGKRGSRAGVCPELIGLLAGSEDGLVVNNNAAAILLILSAFAKGREVVVSRGEQVQIGGGFRIPDILALSGARLVEVGTTNVTTQDDYLKAITSEAAIVLVVHPSNFRIRGFTEKPDLAALAKSLPEQVILVVDQGSGVLDEKLPGEVSVRDYLKQGARLVCFSGDKILGGPQAGIIAGNKNHLNQLRDHPLMRAFRPGKVVYSLLEEQLLRRLRGVDMGHAGKLSALSVSELTAFGQRLLQGIPEGKARLRPWPIATGGGSSPDETFPSVAIELGNGKGSQSLQRKLRDLPVPIIGVIAEDHVILSLATMYGEDEDYLATSIAQLLAADGREGQPCM